MSIPKILSGTITLEQAFSDICESVAMEEAALAHILNAEGEELQRVVACSNASDDVLIETNRSIRSMVNAITRLEIVLQAKLELFEDFIPRRK